MGRANKKHHYIPQCYLRNFSYNGTKLHSYDKISSQIYAQNISDACQIPYFYKLSEEYIKENPIDAGKELAIECEYFANNIEPEYSKAINALIEVADRCINEKKRLILDIDFNTKKGIATFLAIQFLRLPYIRTHTIDTFNDMMPQMLELFKQGMALETKDPKYLELNIKAHCDPALEHANTTFMNEQFVDGFAEALANNYWSFLVSEKGNFYTSDFPIVVEPHVKDVRPMYLGLTQYGAEVTFPISKNLVLAIWDKEYFADKKDSDCGFTIIDAKEERRLNYLRYFYAKRHVFSFHNDFQKIEFAKAIEGGKHIFKGMIVR